MARKKHKQSKDPKIVAKRKKKVQARQQVQAPLFVQMQGTDCPPQESKKLLRRVPEAVAHNPDFKVVRFCRPGYPSDWIQREEEVEPFANFINDAFQKQPNIRFPLDIHLAGGYVLVLVANEASAEFARSLLPGLRSFLGMEVRVPSMEEIKRFHATVGDRSPGMFKRFGPRFQPKKTPGGQN